MSLKIYLAFNARKLSYIMVGWDSSDIEDYQINPKAWQTACLSGIKI